MLKYTCREITLLRSLQNCLGLSLCDKNQDLYRGVIYQVTCHCNTEAFYHTANVINLSICDCAFVYLSVIAAFLSSTYFYMLWVWKIIKASGLISDPPDDLVIVSFMQRQFRYGGEVHTRPGNVYFHCMTTSVRQKQPAFDPRCHCTVPHEILRILTPVHVDYIEKYIGISL